MGVRSLAIDTRGSTAVEFALVAPLLFALLLAVLETGRLIWVDAALDQALAKAARCASLGRAHCPEGLEARLQRELRAHGVPAASPRLRHLPGPCGTVIRAELRYPPLVPALWPRRPLLSAMACRPG
jgi:Flp pilus assembly pilin Flp